MLRDFKDLMIEWDFTLNPHLLSTKSSKMAWWVCKSNNDHNWQATIANRTNGRGCPFCAGKQVLITESFAHLYKEIASEWNYKKNKDIIPTKFTPFSNRRVWWTCSNGHEWEAQITNRTRGSKCPYCTRNKVSPESSIATTHPELVLEWHPSKNEKQTHEVFYGSQKIYWWVCKEGHEWEASCNNRSRGKGCPYCSGHRVSNHNSLANLRPEICFEWHSNKNGFLTPNNISIGSDRFVWWTCSICGYDWRSRVKKRAVGQGCPECKKQHGTSFLEQALFYYISKIFNDAQNRYHVKYKDKSFEVDIYIPSLNLGIEYDGSFHGSVTQILRDERKNQALQTLGIDLIRIRLESLPEIKKYGSHVIHENKLESTDEMITKVLRYLYKTYNNEQHSISLDSLKIAINTDSINILERYIKSKKEISIIKTHPELIKEWHPSFNNDLKPENFSNGSNNKLWWICKHGHEWKTTINHRTSGTACPYCSGLRVISVRSLASVNPILAKEWHQEKNGVLYPNSISICSNKRVWWKCKYGHEWHAPINNRSTLGRGCPYCSGRNSTSDNCLSVINPELAKQWHPTKNTKLTPNDVKPNSGKRVWWKCDSGHEWEAIIQSRNRGRNCPYCYKIKRNRNK